MATSRDATQQVLDIAIRLGLIFLLAYSCYQIFRPFLMPVAWGMIIAVALLPILRTLEARIGTKAALGGVVLIGLGVLIVPTILLGASMVEAVQNGYAAFEAGDLGVPPPPPGVADWPVIGERVFELWSAASTNLTATAERFQPQIEAVARSVFGAAASGGATVVQFMISILIAGAFMANVEPGYRFAQRFAARVAGSGGPAFIDLATATTRSVAQGVLGIALIQAALSGFGMLVVGVPAAGLWALFVLILAIVQLPPLLVLAPVIAWVFGYADGLTATLFAVWSIAVGFSDTFLKPLLLGRGIDVPMLVILVGAIGGMILAGLIGLFVGAVTLALAYRIFMAWLGEEPLASEGS